MTPVALVTGASRGLGATVAGLLAGQGWPLLLTARGAEELTARTEALKALGAEAHALPGDVSDPVHRRALLSHAEGRGGVGLLVNNASALGPTPLPRLVEYPLNGLRAVLEMNLLSPLALVQEAYPQLRRNRGWVVNITSDAAVGAYPGWGGYGASKAALDLVSRTLAQELRADGITVVSVDPGDLRTAMHQAAYPGEDISDRPLPEITLPFFAWLLGQPGGQVTGQRFRAQSDVWGTGP
jgi:NAD(P)-dependent dehydrogenase (short-subunit alcohol dehydrogenase family)